MRCVGAATNRYLCVVCTSPKATAKKRVLWAFRRSGPGHAGVIPAGPGAHRRKRLGDPNSYGFRVGRCCADALERCRHLLRQRHNADWVLEGDIKSCFDRISHDWLLTHIPMDKVILRQWLKAGYLEAKAFHPTETGTPQGGIMSPALANMALDGLQAELQRHFSAHCPAGTANQSPFGTLRR